MRTKFLKLYSNEMLRKTKKCHFEKTGKVVESAASTLTSL